MTIELNAHQQRLVDQAIRSGAYRSPDEVIDSALSMLAEDIEDARMSPARAQETRPQTGQALVDAAAKLRGLLSDEEVDTLFTRNPSSARPVDFE